MPFRFGGASFQMPSTTAAASKQHREAAAVDREGANERAPANEAKKKQSNVHYDYHS